MRPIGRSTLTDGLRFSPKLAWPRGDMKEVDDRGCEAVRIQSTLASPAADRLQAVSSVVHHGGPDIPFGAEARGIPAVVVPESPEQRQRAERLAAAASLCPLRKDPAVITAGLGRLLSDVRFAVAVSRARGEEPPCRQQNRWLAGSLRRFPRNGNGGCCRGRGPVVLAPSPAMPACRVLRH